MGGLRKKMPITFTTFLIATLTISGVPFTTGFVSKDAILAGTLSFASSNPQHLLLLIFGFGAALLTAFYMFRLLFMTFYGEPQDAEKYEHAHESPGVMTAPLAILSVFCFYLFFTFPSFNPFGGKGWFDHMIEKPAKAFEHVEEGELHASLPIPLGPIDEINGSDNGELHASLPIPLGPIDEINGSHNGEMAGTLNTNGQAAEEGHESEQEHEGGSGEEHHDSSHTIAMILSLLVAGTGIFLSWLMYYRKKLSAEAWARKMGILYTLADNKFYFDELYDFLFVGSVLKLRLLLNRFDMGIIDGFVNATAPFLRGLSWLSGKADLHGVDGLVNGTAWLVGEMGSSTRQLQTGKIQNYLLATLAAVLIIILAGIL